MVTKTHSMKTTNGIIVTVTVANNPDLIRRILTLSDIFQGIPQSSDVIELDNQIKKIIKIAFLSKETATEFEKSIVDIK